MTVTADEKQLLQDGCAAMHVLHNITLQLLIAINY